MTTTRRTSKVVEGRRIRELVEHYRSDVGLVRTFLVQVEGLLKESASLAPFVHSMKTRIKDPDHLKDKLRRKADEAREDGRGFDITTDNLFKRVTDLAGIRVLHLHTSQMTHIHPILMTLFTEQRLPLKEKPFARTWDDEYREVFRACGIRTQKSPSLYTSVHYVISSKSATPVTCEIQVRTLMEEVWGEVDHMINYPMKTACLAAKEQIKVLARVTSSGTRLVDSIFASFDDYTLAHRRGRPRRGR